MSDTRDASTASSPEQSASPSIPASVQVRHVAFTLVSVAIVILLLQFMQPVFLPLVLAALLFYALDPAVDYLQRWRVPRAIGAALMLFIVSFNKWFWLHASTHTSPTAEAFASAPQVTT